MIEKHRKKGNKYKQASAAVIINELEELYIGLLNGDEKEQEFSNQLYLLTYKLKKYYDSQNWLQGALMNSNYVTYVVFGACYVIAILFGFVMGDSLSDKIILLFSVAAALFSGMLYLDWWNRPRH